MIRKYGFIIRYSWLYFTQCRFHRKKVSNRKWLKVKFSSINGGSTTRTHQNAQPIIHTQNNRVWFWEWPPHRDDSWNCKWHRYFSFILLHVRTTRKSLVRESSEEIENHQKAILRTERISKCCRICLYRYHSYNHSSCSIYFSSVKLKWCYI